MKALKRILILLIALGFVSSNSVYAATNTSNEESNSNYVNWQNLLEKDITDDNVEMLNWKTYFLAVFEMGLRGSQHFYTVPAKSASIQNAYGVTSGTIQFTNKNPMAIMKTQLKKNIDSIFAFGKLDSGNAFAGNTILIDTYGPNGSQKHYATEAVKSNVGVTLTNATPGEYTTKFGVTNGLKWNVGIFYFINYPPCIPCIPNAAPQPDQLNGTVVDGNYFDESVLFTVPVHKSFVKKNSEKRKENSIISIDTLKNDTFDEILQEYVHSFKSYNSGDTLIVSDRIAELKYDPDAQLTRFGFEYDDKLTNSKDKVYWNFDGDLSSQFSIGDSVSFKVKVNAISDKVNLETLDVFGYKSDIVPAIGDYLVSSLQKN